MMNIAFCTDSNLIKQSCVMIESVLTCNKNTNITFYALLLEVDDKLVDSLKNFVGERAELKIFKLSKDDFTELPIHMSYITLGTYLRFFIEKLVPKDVNKILYLDIDLIVVNNIQTFYNQNIDAFSVAACLDVECHDISRYNRLEYQMEDLYFNAGVMLINLDWWRKKHVSKKSIEYLLNSSERCPFHDQDALNHALHGTVKFASNIYNAMPFFFSAKSENLLIDYKLLKKIRRELQTPAIIHYAGKVKPWHTEYHKYKYPLGNVYRYFVNKTGINLCFNSYTSKEKANLKSIVKKILIFLRIISDKRKIETFIETEEIEEKILERINHE